MRTSVNGTLLGNQDNPCAENQDGANDIEQGGTDATGAGQLSASIVGDGSCLLEVGWSVISILNLERNIVCLVVAGRDGALNQSICSYSKTGECGYRTCRIRGVLRDITCGNCICEFGSCRKLIPSNGFLLP